MEIISFLRINSRLSFSMEKIFCQGLYSSGGTNEWWEIRYFGMNCKIYTVKKKIWNDLSFYGKSGIGNPPGRISSMLMPYIYYVSRTNASVRHFVTDRFLPSISSLIFHFCTPDWSHISCRESKFAERGYLIKSNYEYEVHVSVCLSSCG